MTTVPSNSTFAPTSRTIDPPHQPDYLAGAVLNSLGRPLLGYKHKPWGLIKTVILGGLSFGLLPLLVWPRRFREFVTVEQQQLWHLAEWLRVRTGRPEAIALRDVWTPRLAPKRSLGVYSLIATVIIIWALVDLLHGTDVFPMVYGLQMRHLTAFQVIDARMLLRGFIVLLSTGFFLHWLQVCNHTGALVDYTRKFNVVTAVEGIAPVSVRGVGVGVSPVWIFAALFAMAHGAFWALPMALAGVVHSRYVWKTSRPVRVEFAARVRTMLLTHRPPLNVPMPVLAPIPIFSPRAARPACANGCCRALLPRQATFCPRCGTKV